MEERAIPEIHFSFLFRIIKVGVQGGAKVVPKKRVYVCFF